MTAKNGTEYTLRIPSIDVMTGHWNLESNLDEPVLEGELNTPFVSTLIAFPLIITDAFTSDSHKNPCCKQLSLWMWVIYLRSVVSNHSMGYPVRPFRSSSKGKSFV